MHPQDVVQGVAGGSDCETPLVPALFAPGAGDVDRARISRAGGASLSAQSMSEPQRTARLAETWNHSGLCFRQVSWLARVGGISSFKIVMMAWQRRSVSARCW